MKQDIDNIYYWTINEEWLLDENNNKIKAQGEDGNDGKNGITPQIDIKEGFWHVSYDNGITWNKLDKAIGEDGNDGDSFFQNVDTSETDYVVFTLSNGTIIKIPTWNAFDESQNKNIPYLTFKADAEQTLKISNAVATLQYSVNGGEWNTLGSTTVTFGGDNGNLRLRGNSNIGTALGETWGENGIIIFGNDADVYCSGDIRTLINYKEYLTVDTKNAKFCNLFQDCTSLITAPSLPITTLADNCYERMFSGCTNLKNAPQLPATTLSKKCYANMFNGCTSLESAPNLPSLELKSHCYISMFSGCTNLKTAPKLAAPTLVDYCYMQMFYNCTKLTEITMLATDVSATLCLNGWLYGLSSGTIIIAENMEQTLKDTNAIPSTWTVKTYTE